MSPAAITSFRLGAETSTARLDEMCLRETLSSLLQSLSLVSGVLVAVRKVVREEPTATGSITLEEVVGLQALCDLNG